MNRAIQACNKKYLDGFSTFIANVVSLCFRLVRCAHGGELRFMDDTRHLAASTLYKEERWQSFCRRKGWGKQHVKSHNFQKLLTLHDWNRVVEIYVMQALNFPFTNFQCADIHLTAWKQSIDYWCSHHQIMWFYRRSMVFLGNDDPSILVNLCCYRIHLRCHGQRTASRQAMHRFGAPSSILRGLGNAEIPCIVGALTIFFDLVRWWYGNVR